MSTHNSVTAIPVSPFAAVLRQFLVFATGGMTVPYSKSICIDFMAEDEQGAIAAHTCQRSICFPTGVFTSFKEFSTAIESVVSAEPNFNTV